MTNGNGLKITILWAVLNAAAGGLAWRSWDRTQTELKEVQDTLTVARIEAAGTRAQYDEILRRLARIEDTLEKVRK